MCNTLCSIIPPFILESLAKSDIISAKIAINESIAIRKFRQEKIEESVFSLFEHQINGASNRYVYDCQNTSVLRRALRRQENQQPVNDDAVNEVYEFAGIVRDYFRTKFNLNSIDGNEMDILLNVHYGRNYPNAFWNGQEMTFGDGDGNIFLSFTKAIDIVAHELTHGIIQYKCNLRYLGQSGALNEHFADVFASVIKQLYLKQNANTADWLIGDAIMGEQLRGQAIRSMKNPGTAYDNPLMNKDPQPDHMSNYYNGPDDNYGVHINSGILNKAFYLAATSIGTENAAIIWYFSMDRLWATADFRDFYKIILEVAQQFSNMGTIPNATAAINSAFYDVGIF